MFLLKTMVLIHYRNLYKIREMEPGVNAAIIERLERVVESLQENSVKMGQLLAVHNES